MFLPRHTFVLPLASLMFAGAPAVNAPWTATPIVQHQMAADAAMAPMVIFDKDSYVLPWGGRKKYVTVTITKNASIEEFKHEKIRVALVDVDPRWDDVLDGEKTFDIPEPPLDVGLPFTVTVSFTLWCVKTSPRTSFDAAVTGHDGDAWHPAVEPDLLGKAQLAVEIRSSLVPYANHGSALAVCDPGLGTLR